MKGNKEIIEVLNKSLEGELYAIMQYILHAETCEDLGYEKLAARIKSEAMQEMGHAEMLIERILFLEGIPKLKMNREISWKTELKKNFDDQLEAEFEGLTIYKEGIKLCRHAEDDGTRELLERIVKDEEEHVDWIEAQLHLLERIGIENYLAQHIHNDE